MRNRSLSSSPDGPENSSLKAEAFRKTVASLAVMLALFTAAGRSIAAPQGRKASPDRTFVEKLKKDTRQAMVFVDTEKLLGDEKIKIESLQSGDKKELMKIRKALAKMFRAQGIKNAEPYFDEVIERINNESGAILCLEATNGDKLFVYVGSAMRGDYKKVARAVAAVYFWPEQAKKRLDFSRMDIKPSLTAGKFNSLSNEHEAGHLHQTGLIKTMLEYEGAKGFLLDRVLHIKMLSEKEADTYAILMQAAKGDYGMADDYAKLRLLGTVFAGPEIYKRMYYKEIREAEDGKSLPLTRFAGAYYRTDEEILAAREFADDVSAGRWDKVENTLKTIFNNPAHRKNNEFLQRAQYTPDIGRLMSGLKEGGLKNLGREDIYAITAAMVDSLDEEYKRMAVIGYIRSGTVDGKDPITRADKIMRVNYLKDGMSQRQRKYLEDMLAKAESILSPALKPSLAVPAKKTFVSGKKGKTAQRDAEIFRKGKTAKPTRPVKPATASRKAKPFIRNNPR